jgi:hypothetical protein
MNNDYDMKQLYNGLHSNSKASAFLGAFLSGEQRTMAEWAEKLDITYLQMSSILIYFRQKKNLHIHPNRKTIRVGVRNKRGVLIDIMKNEETLVEGLGAYEDNVSLPHLTAMLRKIEVGVERFPQISSQIESFADRITRIALDSKDKKRAVEKRLKLEAKK